MASFCHIWVLSFGLTAKPLSEVLKGGDNEHSEAQLHLQQMDLMRNRPGREATLQEEHQPQLLSGPGTPNRSQVPTEEAAMRKR